MISGSLLMYTYNALESTLFERQKPQMLLLYIELDKIKDKMFNFQYSYYMACTYSSMSVRFPMLISC